MDEYEIFLDEHKIKCRCCFKKFKKGAKSVKITKEIENLFLNLTQLELKSSRKKYSQNICRSCFSDLTKFSKFKEDLIAKQMKLYEATDEDNEFQENYHDYSIKDSFVKVEVKQEIEDLLNESSCIVINQNNSILKSEPISHQVQNENPLSNFYTECKTNLHDFETKEASSDSSQEHFDEFFKEKTKPKKSIRRKSYKKIQTKHSCTYCNRVFQKEETLQTHINAVHYGKQLNNFQCLQCDFKTYSASLLKGHVNRIHDENKTKKQKSGKTACSICGLLVNKVSEHMRNVHIRPKNVFCDICGFGIFNLNRLRRHMYRHLSKETKLQLRDQYVCDICGSKVHTKNSIQSHIKNLHRLNDETFLCDCGKTFKTIAYLKIHQRSHNKELKHKCSQCDKLFLNLSYLKIHMEIHERKGQKDFTCEYCGKKYASLILLQKHKIFHTEPTIPCQQCDRKFHRPCFLSRHIKRSHEIVLVDCEHCGKQLNILQVSRHNKEFHSGLQKSTCPVPGCNSAYLRKTHMKEHIERSHKNFTYGLTQDEKEAFDQHINEMNLI